MVDTPEFHPKRGVDAFPSGCPACGDKVREYRPDDGDMVDWWRFECGGELFYADGLLTPGDGCPDAMQVCINTLLIFDDDAPS